MSKTGHLCWAGSELQDQLSGLRASLFRDHHGIGWGGKNREWMSVMIRATQNNKERILSDLSGGQTQEKVKCVGMSRKEQKKICSQQYQSAVILSPTCYSLKKSPTKKPQTITTYV